MKMNSKDIYAFNLVIFVVLLFAQFYIEDNLWIWLWILLVILSSTATLYKDTKNRKIRKLNNMPKHDKVITPKGRWECIGDVRLFGRNFRYVLEGGNIILSDIPNEYYEQFNEWHEERATSMLASRAIKGTNLSLNKIRFFGTFPISINKEESKKTFDVKLSYDIYKTNHDDDEFTIYNVL